MPNLRTAFDRWLDRRLADIPDNDIGLERRLSLCRKHGDFSLAYSTAVQPDLRYFGDDRGYIAYAVKMGHIFVLGDPVAAHGDRAAYIRRFVAVAGKPCFVQTGRETAAVLSDLGYRINHMGVDTRLTLREPLFTGKKNETVRYSERWLFKKDYKIIECDGSAADRAHIEALSASWRAGRIVSRREMRFLNRPFSAERTPGMRRFLLIDPQAIPVAILDFDPMFGAGNIIGYTSAFKRKVTGATAHAEVGLTKFAADRFREEGCAVMTLGLSPLARIAPSGFEESRLWRQGFERAFRSPRINERIFNLEGQAAFKRRFHGEEFATYIGFRRGTVMEMVALLRLLKTL